MHSSPGRFFGKRTGARRAGGFTLIEVMITVVIVAILAAVALPSYRTYVLRYYDRVGGTLGRVVEVGPTAAERELGPPPAREIDSGEPL